MTRNTRTQANTTDEPTTDTNATMPLWKALADKDLLNCKRSSLHVACKGRPWLKAAITTVKHEETGHKYAVINVAAMHRYIAERKSGGARAANGMLKLTVFLTDAEREQANQTLSALFGREINLERLYKGKPKTEGEAEVETTESDDGDDGDDETESDDEA